MNYIIRTAVESDAQAVHDIYGQYVEGLDVTFTEVNPSVEAYREKIVHTKEKYPFLVAEDESGVVLGFVYGSPLRPHDSYRWNVESTIYLSRECPKRQGIATALYNKFIELLKLCNYQYVFGVLVDTNNASIELHKKMGFTEVGHFTNVGFKSGQWLGIVWYQKYIGDPGKEVLEPQMNCNL